jgi:hypothetical protein
VYDVRPASRQIRAPVLTDPSANHPAEAVRCLGRLASAAIEKEQPGQDARAQTSLPRCLWPDLALLVVGLGGYAGSDRRTACLRFSTPRAVR